MNEKFGECFVAGRIVNLDNSSIEDLERYLIDTNEKLVSANAAMNRIAEEVSL